MEIAPEEKFSLVKNFSSIPSIIIATETIMLWRISSLMVLKN